MKAYKRRSRAGKQAEQLRLVFDRPVVVDGRRQTHQLILRHASLQDEIIVEGTTRRRIKAADMKHVLTVILDRGRAFGAPLIAEQTQLPLRKVWRILKALQQRNLICVEQRVLHQHDRKKTVGPATVFRPVWNDLALLCPPEAMERIRQHDEAHRPPCPNDSTTVPKCDDHRAQVGTQSKVGSKTESKSKYKKAATKFVPPTLEEVIEFARSRPEQLVDPEYFFNHYQASEWRKKGGEPVTNWRQCFFTFENNAKKWGKSNGARNSANRVGASVCFDQNADYGRGLTK